jgi:hypothetical protein
MLMQHQTQWLSLSRNDAIIPEAKTVESIWRLQHCNENKITHHTSMRTFILVTPKHTHKHTNTQSFYAVICAFFLQANKTHLNTGQCCLKNQYWHDLRISICTYRVRHWVWCCITICSHSRCGDAALDPVLHTVPQWCRHSWSTNSGKH